jgi:hypothetical protein
VQPIARRSESPTNPNGSNFEKPQLGSASNQQLKMRGHLTI